MDQGQGDQLDAVPYNDKTSTTGGADDHGPDSGFDSLGSVVSQHSEEAYVMDKKPGRLILICNTEFNRDLELGKRRGTEKDIAAIRNVFEKRMGFEVAERSELTASGMLQFISQAARDEKNKEYNTMALFILTHGCEGQKLYGTDREILISKLMEPLRNSNSLVGKPKMVFVQSCRGKELDRGKKAMVSDDGTGTEHQVTIPAEADFLYVYSTVDGYVSFQNPASGSWFIQTLCKEVDDNWQKLEMMQILTRVTRYLAYNFASNTPSTPKTHNLKQISSVTTTLTKAIRFF